MGSTSLFSTAISVRALVETILISGHLVRTTGWMGTSLLDAAYQGTLAHQEIQSTRPDNYEAEVSLSHTISYAGIDLKVRGRIDGIWHQEDGSFIIDEIKTHSGYDRLEPDVLHWAQAQIYGYLYSLKHQEEHPETEQPSTISIQITYMDRTSRQIQTFQEQYAYSVLKTTFEGLAEQYCMRIAEHIQWLQERNASIEELRFPYADYRQGQRHMAVETYRTIVEEKTVFVEAPTGIGKTMAVLFPAIKAQGLGHTETLFYLTARTTGRTVAQKALADLREQGLKLRSLVLTARDTICFSSDDGPCDTRTCPFALGYYDRLTDALQDARSYTDLTQETIEELARTHQVCPFEFSLDLSPWADLILCDLNYVFDPQTYLRRHFDGPKGKYTFLIDEAHNLVDRARMIFSAELNKRTLLDVRKLIQKQLPECSKKLFLINKQFVHWSKQVKGQLPLDASLFPPEKEDVSEQVSLHTSAGETGLVMHERPNDLIRLLHAFLELAERDMPMLLESSEQSAVLELYFQVKKFVRIAEQYDKNYVTLYTQGRNQPQIQLYCLNPSTQLLQARTRASSTVFFSATLQPLEYYQTLLGATEEDKIVQLPSPFPPEHLQLYIEDRIATTFKQRSLTYASIAERVFQMLYQHPGNTLVFFPSYAYMNAVFEHTAEYFEQHKDDLPKIHVQVQYPGMSLEEREEYLRAFEKASSPVLAFAVMGGIFGEGIDLVGQRLMNVIIVGVGLPQVCVERDLIREHFQISHRAGFEYAYAFPGMNKVLQAVGRLIRTEHDTGTVLLIDQRFSRRMYRRLFPPWWQPQRLRS